MVQGDAYNMNISVDYNGEDIGIDSIEMIEFTLHNIIKNYPDTVTYSDGLFHFPLSQKETFALPRTPDMQIRVKFKNGEVVGSRPQKIDVERSLSKTIL